MEFPHKIVSKVQSHNGNFDRNITIRSGVTTLLGPNGSGKTHVLRGLKAGLQPLVGGRVVRFISAGRIGLLEQFRADFNGQQGTPRYDQASFGSKADEQRRHSNETLQAGFQTLSNRPDILIKVQERLQKLFRRRVFIEWDGGALKVFFDRTDAQARRYSAAREASGLLQLVGVLAALYDDDVAAILLDEPEVSLHPQLQSFLLSEIHRVAGDPDQVEKKLVVIATHSADMLQVNTPEELCDVVFCDDLNADPLQLDPGADELKNRKLQALIARLGQSHKSAFFAKRPLFVEGPSDVMICKAVANRVQSHLEAAGSHLLPVIGKGEMPAVTKLFRLVGKAPVVLADAVVDEFELINLFVSNSEVADSLVHPLGGRTAADWARKIYGDYQTFLDEHWTEIQQDVEEHPYWRNRDAADEQKARRRAGYCVLASMTEDQLAALPKDQNWSGMRSRIDALLGVLESLGCFVLRRGTVECYYQHADRFTNSGKPSAAADELQAIAGADEDNVRRDYGDIVRCVEYAADTERICEADGLRDLTLAVAAPCVATLNDGLTTESATAKARTLIDSRATIFGLAVEDGKLKISLESKILDVEGFPMEFSSGDDVVKVVNDNLK